MLGKKLWLSNNFFALQFHFSDDFILEGKQSVYGEMRSGGVQTNEEYQTTVTDGFTVDSACRVIFELFCLP